MPMLMVPPGWWSCRSAVACCFAMAAAFLVSLCFVVSGGIVATDFGIMTAPAAAAAAAVAHPGGDQLTEGQEVAGFAGRRLLSGGPGSHPPRCRGTCGSCSPCYPVQVSVPPGVFVTTEYYPEAWRCKCRNQLYMP